MSGNQAGVAVKSLGSFSGFSYEETKAEKKPENYVSLYTATPQAGPVWTARH
jgi:hypothetical protein